MDAVRNRRTMVQSFGTALEAREGVRSVVRGNSNEAIYGGTRGNGKRERANAETQDAATGEGKALKGMALRGRQTERHELATARVEQRSVNVANPMASSGMQQARRPGRSPGDRESVKRRGTEDGWLLRPLARSLRAASDLEHRRRGGLGLNP